MKRDCKTLELMRLFGSKWAFPLMRLITEEKSVSFNDIKDKYMRCVNPRALSSSLKDLMEYGFIEQYDNKGRLHYRITENGRKADRWLSSISDMMLETGMKQSAKCPMNCYACELFCEKLR